MMWLPYFAVLFLLCGDVLGVFDFTRQQCTTEKPDGITVNAETSPPPFTISMNTNKYSPGVTYTVTIASTGHGFQNAMIMTACATCPVGRFGQNTERSKTFNCGGDSKSAIVASVNKERTSYSVTWRPKPDVPDKLRFTARIVYNETLWWKDVVSEEYNKIVTTEPAPTDPVTEPGSTDPVTTPGQTGGSGSRLADLAVFITACMTSIFVCLIL